MKALAPVIIFAYCRLNSLRLTIEALQKCKLANYSEVIVYSDGAKEDTDFEDVASVRNFLNEIKGFKSVKLHFSEKNKGLANSIIDGVSSSLDEYGKIIVLEDDLIVSENFLIYMNQALIHYKSVLKVFSVSGYSIPIKVPQNYKFDVYFTPRASSWGWATWADRWDGIDWEVSDYLSFRKDKTKRSKFNEGGSDMVQMLERQMKGEINSWAIRWCYHQFKVNKLTVYPVVSKIQNIGFSNQATHSNVYNRYKTCLDNDVRKHFSFLDEVKLEEYFLIQFQNFFSVKTRVYNKLKTYLYKVGILANENG